MTPTRKLFAQYLYESTMAGLHELMEWQDRYIEYLSWCSDVDAAFPTGEFEKLYNAVRVR